jgi:hypothetical protein
MDNVPEEDMIEHEKQKGNIIEGGDDGDDSPTPPPASSKYSGNVHGPLPHIPPPFSMMGMMPPMPHMGHMMGHMMPHMMMQHGNPMMMMPPHLMPPLPPVTSSTANVNSSTLNMESFNLSSQNQAIKPLFPSAVNLDVDGDRYSSSNGQQKVKIETITAGSKIIHPDEDISLVSFFF